MSEHYPATVVADCFRCFYVVHFSTSAERGAYVLGSKAITGVIADSGLRIEMGDLTPELTKYGYRYYDRQCQWENFTLDCLRSSLAEVRKSNGVPQ